eukprot:PhF_6_TR3411/c0_g1_i1/m.4926
MQRKVYSLGSLPSNRPLGQKDSAPKPCIKHLPSLDPIAPNIFKIVSGSGTMPTYVLTTSGAVFEMRVLADGETQYSQVPSAGYNNEDVVDLVMGEGHVVLVTVLGNVASWGKNNHGQCGLGHTQYVSEPTLILPGKMPMIVAIAAGANHTVLLASTGAVLTCGNGEFGQLGHNDRGVQLVPRLVKPIFGTIIRSIDAASNVTVMVSASGVPYVMGEATLGVLGLGTKKSQIKPTPLTLPTINRGEQQVTKAPPPLYGTIESYLNPRRIQPIAPPAPDPSCSVVSISLSQCHAVYLDASGRVYATGLNTKGQLGIGRIPKSNEESATSTEFRNGVHATQEVKFPPSHASSPSIVSIATSNDCTFVQSSDGTPWFFGTLPVSQTEEFTSVMPSVLDMVGLVGEDAKEVTIQGVYPHGSGFYVLLDVR